MNRTDAEEIVHLEAVGRLGIGNEVPMTVGEAWQVRARLLREDGGIRFQVSAFLPDSVTDADGVPLDIVEGAPRSTLPEAEANLLRVLRGLAVQSPPQPALLDPEAAAQLLHASRVGMDELWRAIHVVSRPPLPMTAAPSGYPGGLRAQGRQGRRKAEDRDDAVRRRCHSSAPLP